MTWHNRITLKNIFCKNSHYLYIHINIYKIKMLYTQINIILRIWIIFIPFDFIK